MESDKVNLAEPLSEKAAEVLRACLEEVNKVMERHGVYGIAFASHLTETAEDTFQMHGSILVTDVPARVGQAEALVHAAEEMVGDAVQEIRQSIREAKMAAGVEPESPGVLVRAPSVAAKPN